MGFQVRQAKRQRRPLKVNLEGLSGAGKTYTALRLAFAMRRAGIGKRIVVADSENRSADLYDGVVIDGETWKYEVCELPPDVQNPVGYTEAYDFLVKEGFDIVIMDSLTHAWVGARDKVDQIAARNRNDKFAGWQIVTPEQQRMLSALTDDRAHVITTMRVKSEYERTEENGRTKIRKVGLKTDQRDGTEYEFDMVIRLDQGHTAIVDKVRGCSQMDGKSCTNPDPAFFQPLFDWWLAGAEYRTPVQEHAKAIEEAETLDELKIAFTAVNKDARLSADDRLKLAGLKDDRKAALTPAAPNETAEERKAREFIEKAKAGQPAAA
jgi:hypothetical protein